MALNKLTYSYIHAWCEEWALHPAAVEQALTVFAEAKSEAEILACLCGLANAQRFRLLRAGKLTTPEAVIADDSAWPLDCNPDWNAEDKPNPDLFS